MSISKAQAQALADGFLDDIGSSKYELQPRETYSEIILLAGEFIESAQENLNASNNNASGKLSSSLIASEPEQSGNSFKVDVLMNFYGQFVNKGVKGRKSGAGVFAFKHDKPSKKMVEAIKEWQKRGKASSSNTNRKKSISKNEVKNATISDGAAYAVAQSIVNKGIKATGFIDKAIITAKDKVQDRLGLALKVDIINSI